MIDSNDKTLLTQAQNHISTRHKDYTSPLSNSLAENNTNRENKNAKITNNQLLPEAPKKQQEEYMETRLIPDKRSHELFSHEQEPTNRLHNATVTPEPCSPVMVGIGPSGIHSEHELATQRAGHHCPGQRPQQVGPNCDGGFENRIGKHSKPPMATTNEPTIPNSPNIPNHGSPPIPLDMPTVEPSQLPNSPKHEPVTLS